MTNPSLVKNGLTLTMKLKLIEDEENLKQRFIVDSGGYYGQGVSIYVIKDEMYCEVAIVNGTWKVRI